MSTYDLEIEQAGGDTTTTAATFVPVRQSAFTLTLRRRAPHSLSVDIPVASHHELDDFVSGREWRIKRNGAHWQTGLMNAASLPGGEDGDLIRLEGWGQAAVLLLSRNMIGVSNKNTFLAPADADLIIGSLVAIDHGTLGVWFPVGGRTIGSAAVALPTHSYSGTDAQAVLNQAVDIEGWAWRMGVDTSGGWTIKANATTNQDLTGSIDLFSAESGGNCKITSHQADGSKLVTNLYIAARAPMFSTRLNGAHSAGGNTLTLDTTVGAAKGMSLIIGDGTANQEVKTVDDVTSGTALTLTANLANSHSDNDVVKDQFPYEYLTSQATAAASVQQAHHIHYLQVNDDSLVDSVRRQEYADAYLVAYNHVLHTATVLIPNEEDIKRYLDLGLHPGDTIKLTSAGKLSAIYDDTTVTVQDMILSVTETGETLTLQVGDPLLDALATLEGLTTAARIAGTRSV